MSVAALFIIATFVKNKISINSGMNKQIVYSYYGTLYSTKKEWNVSESHKGSTKRNHMLKATYSMILFI